MKVLGMGNALVDVLAQIEDDNLLEQLGLPKGSMQLIDEERKKSLDKVIDSKEKHIASGGSASNTIVGLAKLNIETGFIGRVGQDYFGEYYKKDLQNCKVNSHLCICDTEASGVATTFISKDGQRTFGTFLGAAAALDVQDLKDEDFVGYDYFYIEGYLVQNLDLIRSAIKLAKKHGLKVILDMASYNVVEASKDFLLEIIPEYVDIIFANEEEAWALVDKNPEEALDILAEQVDIAIVKVGEKGSWIKRSQEKVFIPAMKVECIDTTGAGDLYASGFIYGLIKNLSLNKCGEIGTLLAGNVIQYIGPKMDDAKWKELISLIEKE
jgi:Sugar kinases, ribokinase family